MFYFNGIFTIKLPCIILYNQTDFTFNEIEKLLSSSVCKYGDCAHNFGNKYTLKVQIKISIVYIFKIKRFRKCRHIMINMYVRALVNTFSRNINTCKYLYQPLNGLTDSSVQVYLDSIDINVRFVIFYTFIACNFRGLSAISSSELCLLIVWLQFVFEFCFNYSFQLQLSV